MGIPCWSLFWYALLNVLSSFANILTRKKERVGCLAYIVLWMSCYCKCSVTLPRGAVGWSAVCDQSGRVVKAYEYYQTCIATKTFEFFGFLSKRGTTPKI